LLLSLARHRSWLAVLGTTLAAALGVSAAIFAFWLARRDAARGVYLPWRILRLLGVFYVTMAAVGTLYFNSLGAALPAALPLPSVELSTDSTSRIQGRLLNYSNNYWHIIVEPGGAYMAVHYERAKTVTGPARRGGSPPASPSPQRLDTPAVSPTASP
jgi:hypothetical protein